MSHITTEPLFQLQSWFKRVSGCTPVQTDPKHKYLGNHCKRNVANH
jgi:hypothetical protein